MCCCCCSDRQPPQTRERERNKLASCNRCCERFMNSSVVNFAACVLQVGGLVGGVFLTLYSIEPQFELWLQVDYLSTPWSYLLRMVLTLLITAPLLSIIWSRLVQGLIFKFNFNPLHSDLGSLEGRPGLPASRRGGEALHYTSVSHWTLVLLCWTPTFGFSPSIPYQLDQNVQIVPLIPTDLSHVYTYIVMDTQYIFHRMPLQAQHDFLLSTADTYLNDNMLLECIAVS